MLSRIAAALASSLVVVLVLVAPTQAAFPGRNGLIAFSSNRDGDSDIYTMNPDGQDQRQLINEPGQDVDPAWSPDGRTLAFAGDRNGDFDIYVMNADGSGQKRLTEGPNLDLSPAWSPDSTRLAFERFSFTGIQIYLMNSDGSNQVNLSGNYMDDVSPAWSPDGNRIAFESDRDATRHGKTSNLYTMSPTGSAVTRITFDGGDDFQPDFSPDGERIVFARNVFRHLKIHTMSSDGTNVTDIGSPLGDRFEEQQNPAFSPDGQRIVFQRNEQIYSMTPAGSDLARLTDTSARDQNPSWQPIPEPRRSDYKNAAKFCKAERAFWGTEFASRYEGRANANGKCVSSE